MYVCIYVFIYICLLYLENWKHQMVPFQVVLITGINFSPKVFFLKKCFFMGLAGIITSETLVLK